MTEDYWRSWKYRKGHTKRTREKISASNKARYSDPELREKISRIRKGKRTSPETEFKKGHVGYKGMSGRTLPEETRRKLSEANRGKIIPMEVRAKISRALSGNNSHSWKGGVTPINELFRKSYKYRAWRTAVFERDNFTCFHCGIRSSKGIKVILNADHIKPFALFPDLRLDIDNGRTLCLECHKNTPTYTGGVRLSHSSSRPMVRA